MAAPAELGFDLSINLGNLITIASAVIAIVWKASSMEAKLVAAENARREDDARRTEEITEIKNAINKMEVVITTVAVQKERLDNQAAIAAEDKRACNERIGRLERMLDELRHKRGFVDP